MPDIRLAPDSTIELPNDGAGTVEYLIDCKEYGTVTVSLPPGGNIRIVSSIEAPRVTLDPG